MSDSIREQIIQAIVGRVAPLSTLPVQRAVPTHSETTEKVITVWDGPEETGDRRYKTQAVTMLITIEMAFAAADPSPDVNHQMALIIQAVTNGDQTMGELAQSLKYDASTPDYRADGSNYSGVQCTFEINYAYVLGDPFTVAA